MAKGNGAPKRRPAAAKPKPKQVAKKTQESDGEYEESASVPAKRGRKPVDPRSPLPDRKHRNTHPGELPGVQASKKRTHEQVVEAESREEARRRRLAELEVQKIAILAEMELEAEQDAVRESNSVVKNLDDHNTDFDAASDVESPRYIPPDEFTGQAAMSDDDDMGSGGPYLDDLPQHSSPDHRMDAVVRAQLQEESQRIMVMLNSQTAQQAVIPVARPRGQKKGAIRMAVDATKAQIKEGKQSGGDSIQATDPKKLKPLFQFPAGLKNNWQKSADKSGPVVSRSSGKKSTAEIVTPLGGLIDDDGLAARPSKSVGGTSTGARSLGRKNDLIHFVGDSDDEVKVLPPAKARKQQPRKANVKAEPAGPTPLATTSSVTLVSSSPSPQIPSIIESRWRRFSLPTLTNLLGSSLKPFECGTDLEELQDAFNRANPAIRYQLVYGDPVHSKIRTLMYNRRALFPIQAALVVKNFFSGVKFVTAEDPVTEIKEYVAYALRTDGPMLYLDPAPKNIVNTKQPGYTHPEGYCESAFIIDVLKPFASKLSGSQKDYGRLHGAVGLAAAALEKQFQMWATGEHVAILEDFSRETAGDIIDDYIANTLSFPPHRWDRINTRCGICLEAVAPTISMSSKSRRSYVASSP